MTRADPCPEDRCAHDGGCVEGIRRRAHTVTIVPSPKMDAPGLVAAVCSCENYRSSPGTEPRVRAAHADHAAAKGAVQPVRPTCPACGSPDPADVRMTGCGFRCDDPSRFHAAAVV